LEAKKKTAGENSQPFSTGALHLCSQRSYFSPALPLLKSEDIPFD